ncbi:MAG: PBP1A family penicillin-binding protein [Rhodospirillales bacterium]|nr:PBP1A family penicillin-binding protein [Rhodospirillales bacterium]
MAKKKKAAGKTGKAKTRTNRSGVLRVFAFCAKWTAVAAVWGVIALGGIVAWYAYDLPDVDTALQATRQPSVTLLAADGSTLATTGRIHGVSIHLKDLPAAVPQAVLATEDRRFYDHFGIDMIGLVRAAYVNARAGRIVQGGSTISQQVAKNLFLSPKRTIRRKVQELLLALWLEHRFTKDQILSVYLNRVYLGSGTYGIDAASRKYFGHSARDLSIYESAMLAGLLKAPSRYNPVSDPKKARRRAELVLLNMRDAGYLNAEDVRHAKNGVYRPARRTGGASRYFADWVLERVSGYASPANRDLIVTTTLDPILQRHAETQIETALAGAGKKKRISQAALVAMSPDGAVRAMVGGRNYAKSQFNRATQARRQPGSAFKPLVYLAGLEAGLNPQSVLSDAPVSIDGWKPKNFDGKFAGDMTLADALARSVNTVAVRVAQKAGYASVIDVARRLGVTSDLQPTPAIALGVGGTTLTELTAAYAVFANGGDGVWPFGIEEIRDSANNVIYRRQGSGPGRVVEPAPAAAMNRMLARVIAEGTGRKAQIGRPAAGKTGTSQNHRDAWFVGFTAHLVTGIWMGNDDERATRKVTGGGLPAKTWGAYMTAAHKGVASQPLPGTGKREAPAPQEGFWNRLMQTLKGEG